MLLQEAVLSGRARSRQFYSNASDAATSSTPSTDGWCLSLKSGWPQAYRRRDFRQGGNPCRCVAARKPDQPEGVLVLSRGSLIKDCVVVGDPIPPATDALNEVVNLLQRGVYRRDRWTPCNSEISTGCRAARRRDPTPNDKRLAGKVVHDRQHPGTGVPRTVRRPRSRATSAGSAPAAMPPAPACRWAR